MFGRKPALAIGALIGLSFSWAAGAQSLPVPPSQAGSALRLAQYDGPPGFDGPGPDGYGPPPGMEGPPPGYGRRSGYEAGPGFDGGPGYGGRPADGGGPGYDGEYRPRQRSAHAQGGGVQHVTYHGFRIDLSEAGGSRNLTSQIASMEHQIDLVDSVGLSMADLSLFRNFPIKITSTMHGGGHYSGGPVVTMGSLSASDRRPVLLHEFMHVYHRNRLAEGFQNPDIRAFYEQAKSSGGYPEGSYMLKDPAEFFAMTASCYLYGTVARPPFDRATIRTQQPDYYSYLARLFGPPHGSHSAGSVQSRLSNHGRGGYDRAPQEETYN